MIITFPRREYSVTVFRYEKFTATATGSKGSAVAFIFPAGEMQEVTAVLLERRVYLPFSTARITAWEWCW